MDLYSVLNKLQNVQEGSGGNYSALCPAHNDKNNSLSVKDDGNKIILHWNGVQYLEKKIVK